MAQTQVESTLETAPTSSKASGLYSDVWRRLRRNRVAVICLVYILLLILMGLFANFIAPRGYDAPDFANRFVPPNSKSLLGTDNQGRDVFSRLIYGTRVSLGVALVVVTIEALLGITLGLVAGYFGGRVDLLLMRVTDVVFSIPDILLAILLVAAIQPGPGKIVAPELSILMLFVALGIVYWPGLARLVRGQALALRSREFVEAARAIGVPNSQILWRHLLPNISGPIIVQLTQDIAQVMLAEATLSFLGLGVQPPYPSWGQMIRAGLDHKETYPYLLIAPAVVLGLTVMAFNFFGDALRDALDPRLRD